MAFTEDRLNAQEIRRNALIAKVQARFDAGDFRKAEETLSRLFDEDAYHEDVKALRHELKNRDRYSELYELGTAALRDGKLEEAVEYLRELCKIEKGYRDAAKCLQEAIGRLEAKQREKAFLSLLQKARKAMERKEWSKRSGC
jgi:outer membrane protein assembly factor BamD (BamD/ComL family)